MEMGGLDFIRDKEGQLYLIDLNATSNFTPEYFDLLGFDPVERMANYTNPTSTIQEALDRHMAEHYHLSRRDIQRYQDAEEAMRELIEKVPPGETAVAWLPQSKGRERSGHGRRGKRVRKR